MSKASATFYSPPYTFPHLHVLTSICSTQNPDRYRHSKSREPSLDANFQTTYPRTPNFPRSQPSHLPALTKKAPNPNSNLSSRSANKNPSTPRNNTSAQQHQQQAPLAQHPSLAQLHSRSIASGRPRYNPRARAFRRSAARERAGETITVMTGGGGRQQSFNTFLLTSGAGAAEIVIHREADRYAAPLRCRRWEGKKNKLARTGEVYSTRVPVFTGWARARLMAARVES